MASKCHMLNLTSNLKGVLCEDQVTQAACMTLLTVYLHVCHWVTYSKTTSKCAFRTYIHSKYFFLVVFLSNKFNSTIYEPELNLFLQPCLNVLLSRVCHTCTGLFN